MSTYIDSILEPRKVVVCHKMSIDDNWQEITSLTKRLFLQTIRRPSSFISGIIQPLLWLILFSGLFQNIPVRLFGTSSNYGTFLSCGILIFASFTGSLNAGLPLIFDREFGFLNRLLAAPIAFRYIIILAATFFIICITMAQNSVIILYSFKFFNFHLNYKKFNLIILILLLITASISSLSLCLAFILPGHIEFLAFILIINLPMLFASTALAPIYFMPYWLQIISKLNLLTYAIEATRFVALNHDSNYGQSIIQIFSYEFGLCHIFTILALTSFISFSVTRYIIYCKIK